MFLKFWFNLINSVNTFTAKVQNRKLPQHAKRIVTGLGFVCIARKSKHYIGLNGAYVPPMAHTRNMKTLFRGNGCMRSSECVKKYLKFTICSCMIHNFHSQSINWIFCNNYLVCVSETCQRDLGVEIMDLGAGSCGSNCLRNVIVNVNSHLNIINYEIIFDL